MSQGLRIAIITDEMSPLVKAVVDSEYNLVAIAALDESAGNKPSGLIAKLKALKQRLSGETSIESLCEQQHINHLSFTKKSIPELIDFIAQAKPDITLLYCVPILPVELIEVARLGTVNLHPSLLPAYRGADPASHMALDDQSEGGITVHFVDAGEDTGPILLQQVVPITRGIIREDYVSNAVYTIGVPLLLKALKALAENTLTPVEQSPECPTKRARRLKNDDILNAINWREWPIERVWFTLRFFQNRKGLLPQAINWRRYLNPVIGDFVLHEENIELSQIGSPVQQGKHTYFVHPQGKIAVNYPFSFKTLIKNILEARNGR